MPHLHSVAYQLHEIRVEGARLGRHVWHDAQSLLWPALNGLESLTGHTAPIQTVEWTRRAPVFDQGALGSCTGEALAGWIGTDHAHGQGDQRANQSLAVKLYARATHLDNYPGSFPPDDTGSSGLAVCKAGKAMGYLSEYRHAFSLNSALAALAHGPVITGVPWYSSFDTPGLGGLVTIADGAYVRGGHEFVVIGVDVTARTVHAVNSWGTGWGVEGHFYLGWDTWRRLLSEHGDVTVPVR